MNSFKEYFYLKETNTIQDINHIFMSNIHVGNIDIRRKNALYKELIKLPDWSNIEITGDFICSENYSLCSLVGSPQKVGRNYSCTYTAISSLEGSPSFVGGNFDCSNNPNLTGLKDSGIKYIGGDIDLENCPIGEDQWQYLPIIGGALQINKDLNRNEILTLQRLKALGRIGSLELKGNLEEIEDDNDPFNL